MLTFEEALARVLDDAPRVGDERVAFTDCVSRVLADDVRARAPQPAFDYSAMDGYAVRAAELSAREDLTLKVVAESRTGALIPHGADAVVMQEDVTRDGDLARFARAPRLGENIRRRGEDVSEGAVVLAKGTRVTPFQIALLASVEALRVTVARRPVVSILSTGDELRDAGTADHPGSVVDANGPGLAALVAMCGGAPRVMPFARDDLASTEAALAQALASSDLVITVGGVSVGDHDVVRAAMERAGVALDFWKVAIRPGKPLCMGRAGRVRVLGLPGNPSSATLTFVLFGAPLVRAMQGDLRAVAPRVEATLEGALRQPAGRTSFVRVTLDERGGAVIARPLANQASGAVTSFAWADALAVLPADAASLASGAKVTCVRLRDV